MDETPMDPIKTEEREASKFLWGKINIYLFIYLFLSIWYLFSDWCFCVVKTSYCICSVEITV